MSEMKDQFEVWVLPAWASNTIMETLAMDADSITIEPELRKEIKKAAMSVAWFTVFNATEEEKLQDFIKESLERFS
tara:strand:- start:753 stop:980 length:228 start_codon:yes stop_codon:yes gene_type:complete